LIKPNVYKYTCIHNIPLPLPLPLPSPPAPSLFPDWQVPFFWPFTNSRCFFRSVGREGGREGVDEVEVYRKKIEAVNKILKEGR
jgi:hypothetical protein